MNNKKNLLVSFSGGETSAFMAQWLNNNYENLGYKNIVFVYANTGLENEQTLEFIERCDKHFKLCVQWLEVDINFTAGIGNSFYMTNYENASRKGEPFEAIIKKYGIPNINSPHCTRELKANPILKFAKRYFNNEPYDTAIGIRIDEIDRINPNYKEKNFIYPLVTNIPTSKNMINFFWKNQDFRLELKGYQGNCITCWKKADKKLYQIAKENPSAFNFFQKMEFKYGSYIPENKKNIMIKKNKVLPQSINFFRNNRSANDILKESEQFNGIVKNDAEQYNFQIDLLGGESCEIWSECTQ